MARYRYAGVLAIDPNTDATTVVRSATGTIHVGENWSSPATVYDLNGFPMTTVNTSADGLFPDFYVDDAPVVGFKTSSGHQFYLVSSTPTKGDKGDEPSNVVNRDGYFVFIYPDGSEVLGPEVPAGEKGDPGTSGYPVVVMTQAEYDAAVAAGTIVAGTLYAITAV